jgi:hypothetical protein
LIISSLRNATSDLLLKILICAVSLYYYLQVARAQEIAKLLGRGLKSGKTTLWCGCLTVFGGKVGASVIRRRFNRTP